MKRSGLLGHSKGMNKKRSGTLTWIRKRKVTKSGLGVQATQTIYLYTTMVSHVSEAKHVINMLSKCTVSRSVIRSKLVSINKCIGKQLIQA